MPVLIIFHANFGGGNYVNDGAGVAFPHRNMKTREEENTLVMRAVITTKISEGQKKREKEIEIGRDKEEPERRRKIRHI